MTLTELAKKYRCDKFFNHSYMETYERILARRNVTRLLEIGIGYRELMEPFVPYYVHGASLLMWSRYWPEADIFACDIRKDTLVNDGRIKSVVCDQSSVTSLTEMAFRFTEELTKPFDVVIDDGSHDFEHQKLTAHTLLHYLRQGGVYIIEDTYPDKGAELAAMFGGVLIVGNKRPDDCLVVIHR